MSQEKLFDITQSATIVTQGNIQQVGNRFTLPDGRQIALWLMPELIDERGEEQESYRDISWKEAEKLGVKLNDYTDNQTMEEDEESEAADP